MAQVGLAYLATFCLLAPFSVAGYLLHLPVSVVALAVVGLVLAGVISVPLSTIFYQVQPWDRWVFALVAVILTSTGMLATVIPARRATRVDPLRALRYE